MKEGTCKHYNGAGINDTCEQGHTYKQVMADPSQVGGKEAVIFRLPCFKRNDCHCPDQELPTQEEVAAWRREADERVGRVMQARAAIVQFLSEGGIEDDEGAGGNLPCPICQDGNLGFRKSGFNGHIWGNCSTEGCVQWME